MAGSEGPGGDLGRRNWLAILRIYIGGFYLYASFGKFSGSFFNGLASKLRHFASTTHYDWYQNLLESTIIPNAKIFAILIALGEFCVGLALVLGFITGLFSMIGILMNLNYFWATSGLDTSYQCSNLTFIICLLVLIFTCAGRSWGLDKHLSKKILFRYLL